MSFSGPTMEPKSPPGVVHGLLPSYVDHVAEVVHGRVMGYTPTGVTSLLRARNGYAVRSASRTSALPGIEPTSNRRRARKGSVPSKPTGMFVGAHVVPLPDVMTHAAVANSLSTTLNGGSITTGHARLGLR